MQDCCRIILESITVTLDDGTTAEIPVTWSADGYDGNKAGEYVLTGTLTIDETMTNSQGLTASVTVTVKEKPETPGGGDEPDPGEDDQKPGEDDQKPGEDDQKPGEDDQKPDGDAQEPGGAGNDSGNGEDTGNRAVKTGDTASAAEPASAIAMMLAGVLCGAAVIRKRREK